MRQSYTPTPQNIEVVIPSKLSYVDDILQLVERQLEDGGFSQPFIDDIWIGLREAIISAIRYGNKSDPKKKVVIHACITNNFAKFKISDEGNECQYALMPDSKEMADFLKSKRPLFSLMRHVMDMVCFNQTGNEIVMIKKKPDLAHAH